MALAMYDEFGDAGFDAWDRWSQGGSRYNEKDARSTWRSCARAGGAVRVTISAVIWAAQNVGWRMPNTTRGTSRADDVERLARVRQAMEREREERRRAQDAAVAEDQAAAAALAKSIWDAAKPAPADHPYLVRKGIPAEGLRIGEWNADYVTDDGEVVRRRVSGALIIPIWAGPGRLSSLQGIFRDASNKLKRDRDYLRNGRKQGCYTVLGRITADTHTVGIGEGYATCYSVHAAMGWPVVVAAMTLVV